MTSPMRSELVSRDSVLKLLTNEETARVSMAETKSGLADGADYIDLDHLDKGVQRAGAAVPVAMSDIVPRTAVGNETWTKILAHLAL